MSNKVYICSPYRGKDAEEVRGHIRLARRACRMALRFGFNPVAPHLFYPQFMSDDIPGERHRALVLGLELLLECVQVWVFGMPSEGMKSEIEFAKAHNIPAYYKEVRDCEV